MTFRSIPRRPRLAGLALLSVAALAAADATFGAGPDHGCPDATTDLGTFCLSGLQTADGRPTADYFTAARTCSTQGGTIPPADQLIGAADRVKLAGRIDDDPAVAIIDPDSGRGRADLREMSSTLVTTRSGSGAAGTLGVSEGAKGDPAKGEPDPAPEPADTAPSSLQYVTVVANHGKGGFAGSQPVGDPARFRCVFYKQSTAVPAGPVAAAPTTQATSAPRVSAPANVKLTTLGHTGVTGVVACPVTCTYTLVLQVPVATARRVGLTTSTKRAAVLATNGTDPETLDAGGQARVRLRPRPSQIGRMRYWLKRLHLKGLDAQVVLASQAQDGPRSTTTRKLAIQP
jgi:hypothetical protein